MSDITDKPISVEVIKKRFMSPNDVDGNPLAALYRADVGYLLSVMAEKQNIMEDSATGNSADCAGTHNVESSTSLIAEIEALRQSAEGSQMVETAIATDAYNEAIGACIEKISNHYAPASWTEGAKSRLAYGIKATGQAVTEQPVYGAPENLDEIIEALHTQYQVQADAFIARKSQDAPTERQLIIIRSAHLHILSAFKRIRQLKAENERLRNELDFISGKLRDWKPTPLPSGEEKA